MNVIDELLEKNTDGIEEVIIGLVGAIGSNLSTVQNILKTELEDTFGFDTFIIKVSEDILTCHPNVKDVENFDTSTKYKRISSLMDLGNKLREFYGEDYIVLEIAAKIRELRKSYQGKNKRVAYIINSLKHDAEVISLKKLYGHSFFQISVFESKDKRKETLNNTVGMSIEEANLLIKRDEKENEKWGQRTSVAFPRADYFLKLDDKSSIHIKNAITRFIKLILGNPFITPTFSESAIYMAFMSSLSSSDLSRQVGAVIAKNDSILATGTNDVPKFGGGLYTPKYDENDGRIEDQEAGRDYKYKGGNDCNHIQRNRLIEEIYSAINEQLDGILSENIPSQNDVLVNIKKAIQNSEIRVC